MYLKAISTEKTLCHSKAFGFVIQQFAQLVSVKHTDDELPFGNQSQVTYGTDESGTVIAASVHSFDPNKRVFWIQFSAVDDAHRRRGAYKEIFAEVVRLAKRAGAAQIYSGVAIENEEMHEAAKKLERKPLVVRYGYTLGE